MVLEVGLHCVREKGGGAKGLVTKSCVVQSCLLDA